VSVLEEASSPATVPTTDLVVTAAMASILVGPLATTIQLATTTTIQRDRDPRLVYLARLTSAKSRRAIAGALERVAGAVGATAAALPWSSLRYQHTQAIRAQLVQKYAPATVNHALAALRGVLREAVRLELLSAEDAARASDLPPARGSRLPRGRAILPGEMRSLFAAAALATNAGARDRALLAVLYGCGLRRAELVELELVDYDAGARTLRVRGKGDKERSAHVAGGAAALATWLTVRGTQGDPLFVAVDRFDRVVVRKLSEQAVRTILKRLARRAEVASFSPHDVRRTFIGDLLEAGADIATVQRMSGHSQVTTTARYDRRGDDTQRRAAGLLRIDR